MKHFLLPLVLVLFHLTCFSQHSTGCQHEEMRISPSKKAGSLRTEEIQAVPDTAKLIRIPVVFNVVHLGEKVGEGTNVSDETLKKNIEILNTYYRVKYDPYAPSSDFWYNGTKGIDTKVEFYLADLDSTCNYSSGIRRINGSAFPRYKDIGITYEATSDGFYNDASVKNATGTHTDRYLNIWVVNKIFSNTSVIGYAYMPSGYGLIGKQFGIVAIYDNIDGVIVHEAGHVLGLSHEDMAVDGINGLHGYRIIRESANFYASKLLAKPLVCQPTVQNEAGLVGLRGLDRAICKGALTPKIKLKNYGKSALTSCQLNIYNGSQLLSNYAWSGSLNSLDTTWVTLPALTLQEGSYDFRVVPASVNGQQDANHKNDTAKATTKVVGFLSTVPFITNFDGGSITPFVLSKSDSSDARLLAGTGVGNSIALLLEGHDKESIDGTPPPESYDPFFPFDDRNRRFFAYSDVCINSGANKHYKVKFNRYQDSWGSSFFKVLANGVQTTSYTRGRERVWKTDSVVASSYSNGNILLTFQSSCDYSYATIQRYGYGSYILIDNLSIQETAASPFAFNFVAPASNKGCAPLSATLTNLSTGAPMPINYHMNLIKDGVVLDTLHQFNTVDFYKGISESGLYGLKITAFFQDGTTKTTTVSNFANTSNTLVNGPITETFEGPLDWRTDNNSSITSLDWRTFKPGSYGTSNTSLMINQMGVSNGFTTLLLSLENGPYDFSNIHDAVAIKFDRAYAGSSTFWMKDEYLSIKYSADCGKNWKEVYNKTGDALQTIPVASNAFTTLTTPKNTEWATDIVHIDTLAGLKDVLLKFEFHPSFGNSFYIDNISVGSTKTLGLPDSYSNLTEEVVAFPNPASHYLDIKSSSTIKYIRIYDAFGALVTQSNQLPIAVENLATGVYSALVTTGNGTDMHLKFVKVP